MKIKIVLLGIMLFESHDVLCSSELEAQKKEEIRAAQIRTATIEGNKAYYKHYICLDILHNPAYSLDQDLTLDSVPVYVHQIADSTIAKYFIGSYTLTPTERLTYITSIVKTMNRLRGCIQEERRTTKVGDPIFFPFIWNRNDE